MHLSNFNYSLNTTGRACPLLCYWLESWFGQLSITGLWRCLNYWTSSFFLCTSIFDYFLPFMFLQCLWVWCLWHFCAPLISFVLPLSKISIWPPPLSPACGRWPGWQLIKRKSGWQPAYNKLYSQFSLVIASYYHQFNRVKNVQSMMIALKISKTACLLPITETN